MVMQIRLMSRQLGEATDWFSLGVQMWKMPLVLGSPTWRKQRILAVTIWQMLINIKNHNFLFKTINTVYSVVLTEARYSFAYIEGNGAITSESSRKLFTNAHQKQRNSFI